MKSSPPLALSFALLLPCLAVPATAALTAYTPDADTRYLYHFDEAAGGSVAANAGTTGFNAIAYNGTTYAGDGVAQPTVTTVLGATGYTGFGNAANISGNNLGLGVDRDGSGGWVMGDNSPVGPDQFPDHSTVFGALNVFTLEAMINLPTLTGANRHIISTDTNSATAADRGFQFRINTTGNLEFHFIGGTGGALLVPVPTTGENAFVANEWFHAALSYDGTNAQFYWTPVDPSRTAASPLGAATPRGVDVNDDMLLVLGNEGRATGAPASSEGLQGLMDEVRISSVARGANDFIFVPEPSTAVLGALGLLGLLRRRRN